MGQICCLFVVCKLEKCCWKNWPPCGYLWVKLCSPVFSVKILPKRFVNWLCRHKDKWCSLPQESVSGSQEDETSWWYSLVAVSALWQLLICCGQPLTNKTEDCWEWLFSDCFTVCFFLSAYLWSLCAFSALTLLVGRQEGHPACKKTEWWGAGVVVCLELGADLHMAQLMPLQLTVSCFSKIQFGFAFLVPAHPGSPGNVKRVCVCVVAIYRKWQTKMKSVPL